MHDLHQTERSEVAGVPVFRVDTPGPCFAMVLFRVGRADEPLTHAGITHLAEHLAFHRLHHLPYEHNGVTEPAYTRFFAEGDADEVEAFVRTVVATLADPPLERVRREARILAEEAAGRNTDAHDLLGRQRYGASPFGRPSYPEFGLGWLDAAHLAAALHGILREDRDPAAVLERYQRIRRHSARKAIARAEFNMMLGQRKKRPGLRNLAVKTLLALPTKHLLARRVTMRGL
jgi:hypothetical protein